MTISWVAFGLVVGFLVGAGAWAADGAVRVIRRPVRWVWTGAIALTAILVAVAPFRQVSPLVTTYPGEAIESLRLTQLDGDHGIGLDDALRGAGQAVGTTVGRAMAIVSRSIPVWLDRYISIGWLSLSLMLLTLYGLVLVRLRRLRRGWPVIELFGIRVRLSPDGGPAVVGLSRAEIVVPRWLLRTDPGEQRLVLAHEREHVRANDPLVLAVCCGLAALVPWHPAVWWMLSRLRLAVELDCDSRVLKQGVAPRDYASLLVDLAERNVGFPLAPALSAQASHLRQRILAMRPLPMRFGVARGGALAIFACASLFLACGAKVPVVAVAPAAAPEGGKDSVVVVDPVARSVPVRDTARAPRPASPFDSLPVTTLMVGGVTARRAYVVVDGVRLGLVSLDSLKNLDPMSIETVEVLKGGAASAVYGQEGADGVILITTKKGQGATPANPQSDAKSPASSSQARNEPLFVVGGVIVSDSDALLATTPGYFFTSKRAADTWSTSWRPDIEQSGLANKVELGNAPQSPRLMNVTFEATSLSDVMKVFAEFSGRSIVVVPGAGNPRVTATIKNMEWQRALDRIVESLALVARADSVGVIRIEPQAPPSVTPRD